MFYFFLLTLDTSKELDVGEEDDGEFIVESKEKMEMDNLKNKYLEVNLNFQCWIN